MKRGNKVLPTSAHRMPPLSIVSNQYHHIKVISINPTQCQHHQGHQYLLRTSQSTAIQQVVGLAATVSWGARGHPQVNQGQIHPYQPIQILQQKY